MAEIHRAVGLWLSNWTQQLIMSVSSNLSGVIEEKGRQLCDTMMKYVRIAQARRSTLSSITIGPIVQYQHSIG